MLYKHCSVLHSIKQKQSGFTLVELIIGIVVLSLSFTVIFSMIVPSATQSANQINHIRSSELGKAMLNEIMGKAFDENSDLTGGGRRCGEDIDLDGNIDLCTLQNNLGNEENGNRALFDDVDDYHGLTALESSLGGDLNDLYKGFKVSVEVCNDSQYDGDCFNGGDNQTAKLIKITVITSQNESVIFTAYKANF